MSNNQPKTPGAIDRVSILKDANVSYSAHTGAKVLTEVELLADARSIVSQHNTSNFTSRVLDELAQTIAKPAAQPPAVGGEPEVDTESFEYKLEYLGSIDRCDVACGHYGDKFHRWDDEGPYVEYEDHLKHIDLYEAEVERLTAHVAPLLADIERLKAEINEPEWDAMVTKLENKNESLRARIAELEAAQGQPVAWRFKEYSDNPKSQWLYTEKENRVPPDRDSQKLFRQAQPATAKVVLPDEKILEAMRQSLNDADGGYVVDTEPDKVIAAGRALIACLDEVAKLNGGA